jgi:CheY-like chemotaxis protein
MNMSPTMPIDSSMNPILLVEDRATDIDLTRRALARRHLLNPIQEARDGEEAIAYMSRWDKGEMLPVVILLDLKLPKVSGLEVLRQLKSHPRYSSIPVVVLTTSAEDHDIEKAYQLGCNSYIVKPVEFDKFMEVAEKIEIYWCAVNTPSRVKE